jgi:hypothetical protein
MSTGLVVLIVLLAAGAALAGRMWWNRRRPEPLRGDWWSDFERDFRRWAAARERGEERPSPRRDAL